MTKKRVLIIIAAVVIALVVAFLIFGRVLLDSSATRTPSSSGHTTTSGDGTGESLEDYPDAAVWLTFPGTDINNPVMQGEDNDYYLRRNEAGEDDVWGCYFADYECSPDTKNYIIYGHSFEDNPDDLRFSQLKRLNQKEFADENQIIELYVAGETRQYKIFSSGYASDLTDHAAIIADPDEKTMQEIIDMALDRSQHDYGVEVTPEDSILTLATCTTDSDMRYVVTAVQIPLVFEAVYKDGEKIAEHVGGEVARSEVEHE